MTDKAGQKVGPGEYKAVITVLAVQEAVNAYKFDNSQFTAVIYFYLND